MAASENPSENHHRDQSSVNGGVADSASNRSNGSSGLTRDNSPTASGLQHNSGIDTNWTPEEQAILDDGIIKYGSEPLVIRYATIALDLPNKTTREVALRHRWMNGKEVSKRRKDEHTRKSKHKKEKVTDSSSKSSHLAPRPGPFPMQAVSLDDDGISYKKIGGPVGELLEQNSQLLQQVSANFSSFKPQENISIFIQARDNIIKVLNSANDTPEIMKQMPPLPVKLNEELANTILPPISHQNQ